MRVQPVHNERALKDAETNTLFIADPHIGIEQDYRRAGARMKSSTNEMLERLINIIEKESIEELVILGDVKHTVPGTGWQELNELPSFFKSLLKSISSIIIVTGNHDDNLDRHVPNGVKFASSRGFIFNGIGCAHGHTWPGKKVMEAETLLIGHTHPSFVFKDSVGHRSSEPCWIRARLNKEISKERYPGADPQIIVMPAFNPLTGGTDVNEESSELLGPLFANEFIDLPNAEVFLLDGTSVGKVKKNIV